MAFVTPVCLLMGVLFPDIAKHGVPYVTYAFCVYDFLSERLKSRFRDVADVFKTTASSDPDAFCPSCAGTCDCLRDRTSAVPRKCQLYHRNGAGVFRADGCDQSDVGIDL